MVNTHTGKALTKPHWWQTKGEATQETYKGEQNHAAFDARPTLFMLEVFERAADGTPAKCWIRNDETNRRPLGVSPGEDDPWFLDCYNWTRTSLQWEIGFKDVEVGKVVKSVCTYKNMKRGSYLGVRDGKLVLEEEVGPGCMWALNHGSGSCTLGEATTRVAAAGLGVAAAVTVGVALGGMLTATAAAVEAAGAAAISTEAAAAAAAAAGGLGAEASTAVGAVAIGKTALLTGATSASVSTAAAASSAAGLAAAEAAAAAAAAAELSAAAIVAGATAATATATAVTAGTVGMPVALAGLGAAILGFPSAKDANLWVFSGC